MDELMIRPIAYIRNAFAEKFALPRQSGLVPEITGELVFEKPYGVKEAFRGMEGYSHLWLVWGFSEAFGAEWSPTVRPPRLGGNTRLGVFATRSPFRPNSIGLSSVTLEEVVLHSPDGPVLIVGGADLLDGTPIYDIKPYLPYVDSHPDARGGFTEKTADYALEVVFPDDLLGRIDEDKRDALRGVLAGDPRPSYQNDPARIYGVRFADYNVKFTVDGNVLYVIDITKE